MYDDPLVEHFVNPRNVGVIDNPDGYGKQGSADCGDMMEMFIQVTDGLVSDVKYRTFGRAAAIASSSMASVLIKGKPLQEAAQITDQTIVEALGGLAESKLHCSVMAADAFHVALEDYYHKHPQVQPAE